MYKDGQSYSTLQQTCLDLATLNTVLSPLKDGMKVEGTAAYVLFDDERKHAELFLPSNNQGIVLTQTSEGNWSNNNYKLIAWKGYVLQKDGMAIFGGQ